MKRARELRGGELVNIVDRIQALLYLDIDDVKEFWNRDKEWDSDTFIAVGEVLADYDLVPHEGTDDA